MSSCEKTRLNDIEQDRGPEFACACVQLSGVRNVYPIEVPSDECGHIDHSQPERSMLSTVFPAFAFKNIETPRSGPFEQPPRERTCLL